MTDTRETVHAIIQGKVQGVWFRAWTEKQATALGLDGWVRNRADGRVEALFSGPADAVAKMIEAAHDGPPLARVDAIDTSPADPPGGAGFAQRSSL